MGHVSVELARVGTAVLKRADPKYLGYVFVALSSVIWGSNGVIVNWVPYSAFTIAFFRVFFGSLALLPYVLLTAKAEMIRALRSWKLLLRQGVLLALGWVLLFYAMKLIAIGNAVLLNSTAPIFVALLAPVFLKEKLERSTLAALALSVTGIVIISFQRSLDVGNLNLPGALLALMAGLAYAAFIISSKSALSTFSNQVVAFYSYAVATILLIPFIVSTKFTPEPVPWLLLLVLGAFNTAFAVTLYLKGLGMVKAQKAVVFTYLEPASAVVFGFLFLGQPPTPLMLAGGLLILIAGYIVAVR